MTDVETQVFAPLPGGRQMKVAIALPEGDPPEGGWPAVLVIHEIFGLTPEIIAVGETFAKRGWAAVVPDVFSAGRKMGCLVRAVREMQSGRAAATTADLAAVLEWFGARPDVDAQRTATIGFCFGGAFALLLGSLGPPGLRAVADNYGGIDGSAADLSSCPPVLFSIGARDKPTLRTTAKLDASLTAAGVEHEIDVYPGAAHSFLTGNHKVFGVVPIPGTSYVDDAAKPAWAKIFAFLEAHVAA